MTDKITVFSSNIQHPDNGDVVFRSYQDLYRVVSLMLQGHKIYLDFDIKKFSFHKHFNLYDVSRGSIVHEKRLIIFIETYKKLNIPHIRPSIDYNKDGDESGCYFYSPDHYELYKDDPNIIFIRKSSVVKKILKADNYIEEIAKYVVLHLSDNKVWFSVDWRACLGGISKVIGLKILVGL